jgi:hypothetical protein
MRSSLLAVLLLFLPLDRVTPAEDPLPAKVKESIKRGIRYLREQENGKGNFEQAGGLHPQLLQARPGGPTALAVVALLNAGVPPDDPLMQRCLKYLRKLQPRDFYTIGLQTMAFCLAGYKQDRELIQRNLKWIVDQRMDKEGAAKGWPYTAGAAERSFGPDHSINFFVLLGVNEAARAGFQLDKKMLRAMRDYYAANRSGQWTYRNTGRSKLSMTADGLSNLLITNRLLPDDAGGGGVARLMAALRRGRVVLAALNYLGAAFPADVQKERQKARFQHPFYCLHSIKQLGRLTGQGRLGNKDWYRTGCEYLVATQLSSGSWEGRDTDLDRWPIVSTSLALIFLSEPAKK